MTSHLHHPLFDAALGLLRPQRGQEGQPLALRADHGLSLEHLVELERLDAGVAEVEETLDEVRIPGLAQQRQDLGSG